MDTTILGRRATLCGPGGKVRIHDEQERCKHNRGHRRPFVIVLSVFISVILCIINVVHEIDAYAE